MIKTFLKVQCDEVKFITYVTLNILFKQNIESVTINKICAYSHNFICLSGLENSRGKEVIKHDIQHNVSLSI